MCGRYNLITDPQALLDFFGVQHSLFDPQSLRPRYNIAPTQQVPIIRDAGGTAYWETGRGRELALAQWRLVPHWSKDGRSAYYTINARAETVADKPAFRAAFKTRCCLIPATGFYEWKAVDGRKLPYQIRPAGVGLFAFAGLWDRWEPHDRAPEGAPDDAPDDAHDADAFDSCAIIVGPANAAMSAVHDRMPIILPEAAYDAWLDTHTFDREALLALLIPYQGDLEIQRISTRVNNARNEGPDCIAPASD